MGIAPADSWFTVESPKSKPIDNRGAKPGADGYPCVHSDDSASVDPLQGVFTVFHVNPQRLPNDV
jgi:hypothetical protein